MSHTEHPPRPTQIDGTSPIRATLFLEIFLTALNCHHTIIKLLVLSSARAVTVPLVFASNVVSTIPLEVTRAILPLVIPHIDVKFHQSIIPSSGWRAMVCTKLPIALGLNAVSKSPVVVTRATLFLAVPPTVQ